MTSAISGGGTDFSGRKEAGAADPATRRPMRILVCVPDPLRDLEGHALVAFQLRQRHGHEVHLVEPAGIAERFWSLAPDAVVLDYVGSHERLAVAEAARRFGVPVIMLPTAVFFQDNERVWQRVNKVLQANRLVDLYLACGNEDRENVRGTQLLPEDAIHVVGCPRFDFYARPYLQLMEARSDLLARFGVHASKTPIVLWMTNTTLAHGIPRGQIKGRVRYGGWRRQELVEEIEDHETQFSRHRAAIIDLARRRPDWTILVKVHPSEPLEPYRALPEIVPNIFCEKNVPVRCVLYHADVVIQRGCTTASEGWMLNKPVIELDIGDYHQAIRADFRAGNQSAGDVDELVREIEAFLTGAPIPEDQTRAREAFIREVYLDVSGRASERCADAIDSVFRAQSLTETGRAEREARIREEQQARERRSDDRMINRVKDVLGVDRDRSLRLWWRNVRDSWRKPRPPQREIDARDLYRRFEEATVRTER